MTSANEKPFTDYYALLGIPHTAELLDIRKAYLLKAKQHHPDAGGSTKIMLELNKAYRTLANEATKTAYDQSHSFHVPNALMSDYKYANGRQINDVDDMTDTEIDSFLDELLKEYRHGVSKSKLTSKQRIQRFFGI